MKSKCDIILEHLQKRGSITVEEAVAIYGITWLPNVIWSLRRKGHHIISEEDTDKAHTRYVLK